MLAGCSSSTILSPRNRLRSEAAAQFQACHFQLPSMSTQRLDLPCSFSRKEASRTQPIRPVGLSVEKPKPKPKPKPIESKSKTSSCSLKQHTRLPPLTTTGLSHERRERNDEFWDKGKSLKRFAEKGLVDDEFCRNRVKRKKSVVGNAIRNGDENVDGGDMLSLGQLGGSGNFWFQPFSNQNSAQVPFTLTCSGGDEEDRVCFVPSEVISQPLPHSSNPWLDSVITELTDLGEKDIETSRSSRPVIRDASKSSASSESNSLGKKLSGREVGNRSGGSGGGGGGGNPYSHEGNGVEARQGGNDGGEEKDFELLSLLTGCVEAISGKNIAAVNHFIAKLGDLANPRGKSPISRLIAYYTEGLALRVTRVWPHIFNITTPWEFDRGDDDSGTAFRFLNQISPIPKFVHFTANEMLLRAFEGKDRVHVIDFDIKQGLQWPGFFQSLASRPHPPNHVRITGIGESKQELNETGDRLHGFADSLNLQFEFHPVVDKLEDVRLWMLHVKEGETVGINCTLQLHKTLHDANGAAFRDFAGLIQSTNPNVVVVAEQEGEHNSLELETRVYNSLKYYSAIFDSFDTSLLPESPVRSKVEEIFAREIRTIVACEGSNRSERHQGFAKWKSLMEQGGFRCMGVTEREFLQSRMLLKMFSFENFSVEKQEDEAAVTLSWLDQPLFTVSAWSPIDVAGSSSSFSQAS